jgi:pilus assembly protein CpaF
MAGMDLPFRAVRSQAAAAIDLIVQVERQRDGGRRITQVTEVCGMEGDIVLLNDIFHFNIDGEGSDGRLRGHYKAIRSRPAFQSRITYFGLDRTWTAALDEAEV